MPPNSFKAENVFMKRKWLSLAVASLLATTTYAHITVQPKQSAPGKTETYTLRVPTEKAIPTIGVEVEFPETLEVTSFEAKPGWKIEEKKNAAGKLIGVVLSGSIPPAQSVQFNFTARNPSGEGKLSFKAIQVYQDGSKVEWTGPEGSRMPAPFVELRK